MGQVNRLLVKWEVYPHTNGQWIIRAVENLDGSINFNAHVAIVDGLALANHIVDLHNNTLLTSKYVIHSNSENAYWSNELGWVGERESATRFSYVERSTMNRPTAAGNDAYWHQA